MPGRKKSAKASGKQKKKDEDEANKIPGPPFHCTFPDCKASFDVLEVLILHKIKTPEHEYCAECNLDFEDDAAFLLHKIKEIEHIVCPICSEDFRSQDGCDRHVRQVHAAEQNLVCVGCGDKFTRAGGLMAHIELNRCPRIPKSEFERRRAEKEIVKAYLADPTQRNLYGLTTEGADSVEGGVPVNLGEAKLGSLMDYDDNTSVISGVALEPRRMSPATSAIASPPPSVTEPFPRMEARSYNGEPQDEEDLLIEVDDLSIKSPTPTPSIKTPTPSIKAPSPVPSARGPTHGWGSTSASTILFPNAARTPATPEWAAQVPQSKEDNLTAENLRKLLDTEHPFHPDSKDFDVRRFYNRTTQKYRCPHPSCCKSFGTSDSFEAHLTSPAHVGTSVR
ncbi:MAG: hypothetical protein M1812_005427 [Candelaria pacifica]|nr:MAG: hypothetical protein M1812_005427 [Candelaria pacifica]